MRSAFSGLRHPASASCLGRHSCLAGLLTSGASLHACGKQKLFPRSARRFFSAFLLPPKENIPGHHRHFNKKLPRRVAGGAFIFLLKTRMRRPDMVRSRAYFRNFATARATMPPRMPDTRNSATPCTPTSSTTNMRGLAAPLTDTRFCT